MSKIRLTDLAKAAGCSVATVSRALHDSPLISRATKTRILQIARTQSYHASYDGPDGLPSGQPRLAIMISAQTSQSLPHVVGPLLNGLVGASLHSPCNLQVCHLPSASSTSLDSIMQDLDADGYLLFGNSELSDTLNRQGERGATRRDARVLVWGEPVAGQMFESIGPDNFSIGVKSVAHLAAAGCRRIAYLGETQGQEAARRFMGYLTALNEAGLAFDSDLILSAPADMKALAFDGLVVASENLYVSTLEGLRDAGRSIPGDLRVVGYTHEAPAFPMETVSIDPVDAAKRILAKLFGPRLKDGPWSEKLPVTLRTTHPA